VPAHKFSINNGTSEPQAALLVKSCHDADFNPFRGGDGAAYHYCDERGLTGSRK
jgi:hypothetical protein